MEKMRCNNDANLPLWPVFCFPSPLWFLQVSLFFSSDREQQIQRRKEKKYFVFLCLFTKVKLDDYAIPSSPSRKMIQIYPRALLPLHQLPINIPHRHIQMSQTSHWNVLAKLTYVPIATKARILVSFHLIWPHSYTWKHYQLLSWNISFSWILGHSFYYSVWPFLLSLVGLLPFSYSGKPCWVTWFQTLLGHIIPFTHIFSSHYVQLSNPINFRGLITPADENLLSLWHTHTSLGLEGHTAICLLDVTSNTSDLIY